MEAERGFLCWKDAVTGESVVRLARKLPRKWLEKKPRKYAIISCCLRAANAPSYESLFLFGLVKGTHFATIRFDRVYRPVLTTTAH